MWPPDYVHVEAWRRSQRAKFEVNPDLIESAKAYYSKPERCAEFICHWVDTFDPRNVNTDTPAYMPLVLFERQAEMVDFVLGCLDDKESGLIEKARDMGASWVCCGISVWLWLFRPGAAVGWGSRKEEYVDKIGDPKSIFVKLRMIIERLPLEFLPRGFNPGTHMAYMRIVNPQNGATITGEAGDNIGRGGRTTMYFKDESAHYAKPELIEAALGDNTDVQIDMSSVNGVGNVFHRRREAGQEWSPDAEMEPGQTRVLILDWSHHPAKTQAWYEKRRKKAEREGLLHKFAQEVDRDYAASIEGVIIKPEWVKAAVDAHIKLGLPEGGAWVGGLDVADEGLDRNAFFARQGIIARLLKEWSARDTGVTARNTLAECKSVGDIDVQYDCIGVGAGVKAEVNRLADEGEVPEGIGFTPWNAAAKVLNPKERVVPGDKDSPLNEDFFHNLKAQGWWELARRFERTYRAVMEEGFTYDPDDLISLPSALPNLATLMKELSQPTTKMSALMKLMVDKKPEGTKSPNLADAVMQSFWPVEPEYTYGMLGVT